jgi:hypothetical protein
MFVRKQAIRSPKGRRKKFSVDWVVGNCLYAIENLLFGGWGVFMPAPNWNVVGLRVRNGIVYCFLNKQLRIRIATTRSIPYLARRVKKWSHLYRHQGSPFSQSPPSPEFPPAPPKTMQLFSMWQVNNHRPLIPDGVYHSFTGASNEKISEPARTRAVQKVSSGGLLKKIYTYITNHVHCHLMYTPYATFRHNFHHCWGTCHSVAPVFVSLIVEWCRLRCKARGNGFLELVVVEPPATKEGFQVQEQIKITGR